MRVAYFTAGDVGAGHLTRGLAIERGLQRGGVRAEVRIFGPPVPFPSARRPNHTVVAVAASLLLDARTAPRTALARALRDYAPDLLLVDMFWAPLRHLLPLPGCEAWLLLRTAPARWLQGPEGVPFEQRQYTRIFAIEPLPRPLPVAAEALEPIVICNPEECQPAPALKARLGLRPGQRLTLVTHAGKAGECALLEADAEREGGEVAVADLFAEDALFPLAPWLGGADRVVGGCGYNLFWETRWLGLAGRTTLRAFPRAIDDQAFRLSLGDRAPKENGADALARAIAGA